nr:MAG TPA: terminase small subunit [Caudoviricetes sp.]
MKELGTYRKEFDMIIDIFSGMLFQYQKLDQDYAEMGYPVTDVYVNKAGAENERKVPILTAMEILRKDILSYSNQLMMNPKSLGEVVEQDNGSVLTEVLKFKDQIKKKRVSADG